MPFVRAIQTVSAVAIIAMGIGCGDSSEVAAQRNVRTSAGETEPGATATQQTTPSKKSSNDVRRFRGQQGGGVSAETGLPTEWNATKNIAWKQRLPGPGASCPIVVGDRIYVTCYSGYGLSKESPGDIKNLKRHLVCLDRKSGKIRWDKSIRFDRADHGYTGFMCLHGYASSTPASDGERVYAFFGNWGAYAFDKAGKQMWRFDCRMGAHGFGSGASPILHGQLLIVNASVESRTIYALNKSTGKEVWRATGIRDAWNTPVIVKSGERAELVVATHGVVNGIDVASGKSLWSWKSSQRATYVCPSFVANDGVLYGMPTYGGPLAAIKPGGTGDVSRSHTVWTNRRFTTTVLSPVYYEGHLYYAHDNGNYLSCFDGKTGVEKKRVRFRPSSGTIYGSPLIADGKLYIVTRSKGTFVFEAKPALKQIAHNTIAGDDSIFNASPVAHNGRLLLRSDRFLYCIGTATK